MALAFAFKKSGNSKAIGSDTFSKKFTKICEAKNSNSSADSLSTLGNSVNKLVGNEIF